MGVELFATKFCPKAQRIAIALREASIEPQITYYDPWSLPKSIFQMSFKGTLPILKDNETVVIGMDKIIPYIEKVFKLSKLTAKKKFFTVGMAHCNYVLEPLVDQTIDKLTSVEDSLAALTQELALFDNCIKGTFYLGNQLSWVDIYYWTVLEKISILTHYHNFIIPTTLGTLTSWYGRISARPEFEKSKFSRAEQSAWVDSLICRGQIRPDVSFFQYLKLINGAIIQGAERLIECVETIQISDQSAVKHILQEYTKFDQTWREYTRCKISIVTRLISKMEQTQKNQKESSKKHLMNGFKREQTALHQVHQELTPIIELANLYFQLSRKETLLESLRKESELSETNKLKCQKTEVVVSILKSKVKAVESEMPVKDLCNKLQESLLQCVQVLKEETKGEHVLYDSIDKQDDRLYYDLFRKIHYVISNQLSCRVFVWVLSHLSELSQKVSFVLGIRFGMPHQFEKDLVPYFEDHLAPEDWKVISDKLWDVTATTENYLFSDGNSGKERDLVTQSVEGPLASIFGEEKEESALFELHEALSVRAKERDDDVPENNSTENSPRGKRPNSVNADTLKEPEKDTEDKYNFTDPDKKKKRRRSKGSWRNTRKSGQLSERGNKIPSPLNSTEAVIKTSSAPPSNSLSVPTLALHEKAPVKPLIILKFTGEVIIHNLDILQKRLKARGKTIMHTIEECLRLLNFLVIKDHQEDTVIHPALAQISDEFRYLHETYKFDHKRIIVLTKKAIGSYGKLKSKQIQEEDIPGDTINSLASEILEILYLQTHISRKEYVEMLPKLDTLRLEDQARLIRAILDFSPIQYFTSVLPWVVGALMKDDQVVFVETLRALVTRLQYDHLFVQIRKVLEREICDSLISPTRHFDFNRQLSS